MLENYLKITLRNIRKHRGFTFINVAGLAIGLACCLLIAMYVLDELSFDRFHRHLDRLYRVTVTYGTPAEPLKHNSNTQGILGPVLAEEVPGIAAAVRMIDQQLLLRYGDRQYQESRVIAADGEFFRLFSYPLLQGDPQTALRAPGSIVLTAAAAQKYWGNENPIGKTLIVNNQYELTVTGLLAEPPRNSSFNFEMLISMSTLERGAPDWMFKNWAAFNFQTYVLLQENANPGQVETNFPGLLDKHTGQLFHDLNMTAEMHLEPLRDLYLYSPLSNSLGPQGSRNHVLIFSLIALFILLVAVINFMNLATARSVERAREVGVRKTVGASRGQLAGQFLAEALLLTLLALVVVVALAELAMPLFRILSGKALELQFSFNSQPGKLSLPLVLALATVVGLLAGAYPALVLSEFHPVEVLKGAFRSGRRGASLRRWLVVLQFGISIALVTATLVVYQQLRYMQQQELGYNSEQVLLLDFGGDAQVIRQLSTLKTEFKRLPFVEAVSASQSVPGKGMPDAGGVFRDADGEERNTSIKLYLIDFDFVDLYDFQLLAGRKLSADVAGDSLAGLLVNEAAVAAYGYDSPEAILGAQGNFWGRTGEVVGVVKNFHQYSLQHPIVPIALRYQPEYATRLSLRLHSDNYRQALADLETLWKTLVPQRPFNYTFLDENFNRQYQAEMLFGRLFSSFSVLAIVIACLGLFGLAAFSTEQRTKEIGIRKVLGASMGEVLLLLSRDFLKLVVIAFLLVTPLSYLVLRSWLQGFAYRVELGADVFLLAGLLALLTALGSIAYQAIRAALRNPVEALRYE